MPYSLVLNFTPTSDIPMGCTSGRHLHALFLNLIHSIDKDLSEDLHKSEKDKSFTVSPLQVISKDKNPSKELQFRQQRIKRGSDCWWRVTLLDDGLFKKLSNLWFHINPEELFYLGKTELIFTKILTTANSHPWANALSYEEIYERASTTESNLNFFIFTPTTFRQGKYDVSLPSADLVFSSLFRRWQKHSNIPLDEVDFDCLFPSFFDLKTEIVIDSRSKFIGCVGRISYKILGDVNVSVIKVLNVLADYGFYCGLGRKTTMGFGMMQRLSPESNSRS